MVLVVTATSAEKRELQHALGSDVQFLVAGVGLVETTFNLTRYLMAHPEVTRVLNLGIGGGFASAHVSVLDCCLATSETIGDLGLCFDTHIEDLDPSFLDMGNHYPCRNNLHAHAAEWLYQRNYVVRAGRFLSVNGVSASTRRGGMVNRENCICENMEGAAVARVCHGMGIDWLEFRVISNLVEDRDPSTWQIEAAINKYTEIMTMYLPELYS